MSGPVKDRPLAPPLQNSVQHIEPNEHSSPIQPIVARAQNERSLLDCCRRKPIKAERIPQLVHAEPVTVDDLHMIAKLTSSNILNAMDRVDPTTPYIGLNATETKLGWPRWRTIQQQNLYSHIHWHPGVKEAKRFAAQHANDSQVSLFGGDSALALNAELSKIFSSPKPVGVTTQYQLVVGDSVKNLQKLDEQRPFGNGKIGVVICANDTRHFGCADIRRGTQEEAITRQSNFFALSPEMDRLSQGKTHFIPMLGVTYVNDAVFMKNNGDPIKADASFVAALDLRSGSDDSINITEVARVAGLEVNELIKFVTKMKFTALFCSLVKNQVSHVLMSIPGLGVFDNDLEMIEKVLHELLFREYAPFANRFDSVTFNVFGDSKTASPMDQKIAAMLCKVKDQYGTPLVDRRPFLGNDISVMQALNTRNGFVVGNAEYDISRHAVQDGYLAFYKTGLTSFLGNFHPCKISIYDKTFECAEAAFQWRKFSMAAVHNIVNGASEQIKAKARALHNDPRLEELFTATGGRAFEIKKQLDREYQGIFAPNWLEKRESVMAKILRAKFEQNEPLRRLLKATGDAFLIEHNESDTREKHWSDGKNGEGLNRLGKLLMWLREEFRSGIMQDLLPSANSRDEQILIRRFAQAYEAAYRDEKSHIYDIFGKQEE